MNEEITVRTGQPADAPACLELLRLFYEEEVINTSVGEMTFPLGRLLDGSSGTVLLASRRDEVAGLAIVALSMGIEQGGLVAELTDLYVSPASRGQGLGRILIAAATDWAQKGGCRRLQLLVTPRGHAHGLIGFYQEQGFRETGRVLLSRPL